MNQGCALCTTQLSAASCGEKGLLFCCHGCMAVYSILLQRGELNRYQDSALFKQAVSSGLISNPYLLETLRLEEEKKTATRSEKIHFFVPDLWCPSCADVIGWVMVQQKGVISCFVDYSTDCASIQYDPFQVSTETLFDHVRSLGYHVESITSAQSDHIPTSLWVRSTLAAFCALHLMMFSSPLYVSYWNHETIGYTSLFQILSACAALPVVTYCMLPLYRRGFAGLLVGVIGMEVLVIMSVLAAFFYSLWQLFFGENILYFDSMAVIVTLVLVGKILEMRAKFSAKEAFFQLLRALPRKGRKRFENGEERFVPLKDVSIGSMMVARSGEKIALDGEVIEGEGAVDESALRGETIPVMKRQGALVMAGSLLRQGRLCYRVVADSTQTLLQQMLNMVERDVNKKERIKRLTDQISAYFVPCILSIAALTGTYLFIQGATSSEIVLRMLSIVLIACPCAIGIAAPLAHSYLLRAIAKHGAVVRNRNALNFLGRPTLLVCDKTGTLTLGRFTLLQGLEKLSKKNKELLKGMTSHSIHPLSNALSEAISESGEPFSHVEEVMGKGLRTTYQGKTLLLGSAAWMREAGHTVPIEPVEEKEALVLSTVYFYGIDDQVHTLLLGDHLRQGSTQLARSIHPCRMAILSGDHETAVKKVAEMCGGVAWTANCLPIDKHSYIEKQRANGEIVLMLGDGVNDTLALARAHVGISVASATEVSTHVSDVLLTHEGLEGVVQLLKLAKKGERILRQNLFWAFFYNILGIILAIAGLLSPLFAAAAMMLSSLIVLWNASRLSPQPNSMWKGWD